MRASKEPDMYTWQTLLPCLEGRIASARQFLENLSQEELDAVERLLADRSE